MLAPNDVNANWIVQSLKQRLKDSYLQRWNARVEQCSSGVNYRLKIVLRETIISPFFQIDNVVSLLDSVPEIIGYPLKLVDGQKIQKQ